MYCSKCISIGANDTITAGCDNFKTSSFTIGMQLVQITRFIASRMMIPAKFQFIWPSGYREDFLEINQSETRITCGGHVC
jgi:hypothetical protein